LAYEQDACIVGVGTSREFGFDLGTSALTQQGEALIAVLDDAGLAKSDLDGIITSNGAPVGVDYEEFVLAAGLDIRWAVQLWSHGRWAATCIAQAALAVSAGVANYVLVANTAGTPRGYSRHLRGLGTGHLKEPLRDAGGGHGEWAMHGFDAPGSATALVAQRYMERYGATEEDLAAVPIAFRAHAQRNPMAIMRDKPMTYDEYCAEPMIAAPFRRADFCLTNEGSTCLIVTTRERALDLPSSPVVIAGFEGIKSSRDDYILFARPGLGVGISAETDGAIVPPTLAYAMAGIDRSDVDALYVYDSFSSNLWLVLERFGFTGEGEAFEYVRETGLGLSSTMPVNTNGGLLSEGHFSGFAHIIEMVRQLRGEAGGRQIAGAQVTQWATPAGDSLILTGGASA
jgi:acetyl-CoA acetyltransferase